jgi:hypothetical protein
MAASVPIQKTIYVGPFVHCKSLAELDICEKGAIGVDEKGVIAFVERDVEVDGLEKVRDKYDGWKDASVVRIEGEGFFFPGFIGMLLLPSSPPISLYHISFPLIQTQLASANKPYQTPTPTPPNTPTPASSAKPHSSPGSKPTPSP